MRTAAALAWLTAAALLGGCGLTIPSDPGGTLETVRGGQLNVGVSPNPPWTDVPTGTQDAQPTGVEVDLVTEFAQTLDAEVEWTVGGEEQLMKDLEGGSLQVVIGGLTAESPWSSHAALTTPYVSVTGPDGQDEQHVVATPMGENAFMVELERFLLDNAPEPGTP